VLVLHAAPHPDDELIGAPATLMALRDAGHQIVNVACSLGRPQEMARREAELAEACRRAGFEHRVVEHPLVDVAHEPGPERDAAQSRLTAELTAMLGEPCLGLVVGPSPHDRHPGHELVGRAVRDALETGAGPDRWWLWGLWGELPFPTVVVPFGQRRLREIISALEAHTGELARNDYRRLVTGRSRAATVLAAELAFGFGHRGLRSAYAEAICEVVRADGEWRRGVARQLDAGDPLPPPAGPDLGWWLRMRSAVDRAAA
jgi:LmbE family N-acetylglucosaminyl deacetylase